MAKAKNGKVAGVAIGIVAVLGVGLGGAALVKQISGEKTKDVSSTFGYETGLLADEGFRAGERSCGGRRRKGGRYFVQYLLLRRGQSIFEKNDNCFESGLRGGERFEFAVRREVCAYCIRTRER